jgi:hypothetical protein
MQYITAVMFSPAMQPVASSSPPPNEVLLPVSRFPNLTLEERSLTPPLGYVFNRKWLVLWKFKTANALPGYALARLMGPRVEPYEGVVPKVEAIDFERLRSKVDLPAKAVRDKYASQSGARCRR